MSDVNSLAASPPVQSPAAPVQSALAVPLGAPIPSTPRYRTFTFGVGFLCGQASL